MLFMASDRASAGNIVKRQWDISILSSPFEGGLLVPVPLVKLCIHGRNVNVILSLVILSLVDLATEESLAICYLKALFSIDCFQIFWARAWNINLRLDDCVVFYGLSMGVRVRDEYI